MSTNLGIAQWSRQWWRTGAAIVAVTPFIVTALANAQTFNQAVSTRLTALCQNEARTVVNPDNTTIVRGNLLNICTSIANNAVGSSLSPFASSAAQSPAASSIEQRLQSVREAEEEKPAGRRTLYALNQGGTTDLAQAGVPPGTTPGHGVPSPDLIVDFGQGLHGFVSAGASAVRHDSNRFEDGYDSTVPTVTVGADYRVAPWALVGLAFNYTNFNGNYDESGRFNSNAYGPSIYATFLPFTNTFINVTLGYSRLDTYNRRRADAFVFSSFDQTPEFLDQTFAGNVSADYPTNQYSAGVLAGYDHQVGHAIVGPRLGLAYSHWQTDSFKEQGSTGLELRYSGLNRTSLQSSLGVRAAIPFETAYGIFVPQATIAWVHEYADDARNIQARFVDADPSTPFTFQREHPARNWATIGVAVSALLKNGLQPFVQFATMQGNENYVSYGGTAGLRIGY
jgi:outer membrane autotransporter protein